MAWAFVANRGTAQSKAAVGTGTGTISISPTANLNSGAVIVVRANMDNQSTTSGPTTDLSLSDSKSNTWTLIAEYTRSSGATNDGTTLGVWATQINTAILTTDTITMSNSFGTGDALAIAIEEFSVGASNGFSKAGANGATGSSGTPSVTLGSLSSTTYLWYGALGVEGPNGDTYTQDADYANNTSIGTTGGVAATNQALRCGTRIFSGTTDTFNPTCTSRDWAIILGALLETTPPTATVHGLPALGAGG